MRPNEYMQIVAKAVFENDRAVGLYSGTVYDDVGRLIPSYAPRYIVAIHAAIAGATTAHMRKDWRTHVVDGRPEGLPAELGRVVMRCLSLLHAIGADVGRACAGVGIQYACGERPVDPETSTKVDPVPLRIALMHADAASLTRMYVRIKDREDCCELLLYQEPGVLDPGDRFPLLIARVIGRCYSLEDDLDFRLYNEIKDLLAYNAAVLAADQALAQARDAHRPDRG